MCVCVCVCVYVCVLHETMALQETHRGADLKKQRAAFLKRAQRESKDIRLGCWRDVVGSLQHGQPRPRAAFETHLPGQAAALDMGWACNAYTAIVSCN